jgi:hypothetical protein
VNGIWETFTEVNHEAEGNLKKGLGCMFYEG